MNPPARPLHWPHGWPSSAAGELLIGGLPLSELAQRFGRTPFYAYDRQRLLDRARGLRAALPPGVHLHYAMKANPLPAVVALMAAECDGLDVASEGELRTALAAGAAAATISFAGPAKRAPELAAAVAAGVLVNVESARELPLLAQAAQALGRPARVALRLNPDFELKGSGMRMGGGAKPFGVDVEAAPALLAEIGRLGLGFEGFHIFAGSQSLKAEAIVEAQAAALALAERLAPAAPCAPRVINLGGGFGIPYFPGERPLDTGPIVAALPALAQRAQSRWPGVRLALELGRWLVGEAGVYVCRVLERKVSRGQVFLITDGGLHHHLAASGNFGQVLRKNYPVALGGRLRAPAEEEATVVGPLCTPLDMLAERLPLPRAQAGDWVVVFQSGAYGASASPQAFLSHPPVLEGLV